MISTSDELHFERICREVLLSGREREGIGTLNEKKLHTVLKLFVCEDKNAHEIKLASLEGASGQSRGFVADVLCGNDIFEIQTGSLYPLRDKIEFYLNETNYNVTVIHPLAVKKRINYLSPIDAHVQRRVNSPRHEDMRNMLVELYSLLPYLRNSRLRIRALMLELEEFRIQKKRGRHGSVRYEKIPTGLIDIVELNRPQDYLPFLAGGLPDEFTAAEFGRAMRLFGMDVYSVLKVYVALGLISPTGKRGRAATYSLTPAAAKKC